MADNAARDENRTTALIAKSDADASTVAVEADPITKRLKTNTTITGGTDLKQSNVIYIAKIDVNIATDNTIVAADLNRKIKVLSAKITAAADVSIKWRSGTDDLEGANSIKAGGGYVLPASAPGMGHYIETAINKDLNLNLSGAVQVSGHISYYLEA